MRSQQISLFKMKFLAQYVLAFIFIVTPILGSAASLVPTQFSPNTVISSSHINENFKFLSDRSWDTLGSDLYFNLGSVGIGTNSPQYKLDVQGGDIGVSGNAAENKSLNFLDIETGTEWQWSYRSNGELNKFHLNYFDGATWNTYLSVNTLGQLGIGTVTPSTALEVVGTVTASSFAGDGSGLTGIAGVPGVKGDQGLQGIQGTPGIKGDIGLTGLTGTKGDQGIQGLPGVKGDQGIQGIQGTPGIKGDIGLTGLTGTKGDQGIQGLPGVKGDQGIQGIQGTPGIKGDIGFTGLTGTKGDQGIQGLPGVKGDQGIQGIQGIQGTPGIKGDIGLTGLTGTKGDQGIQGIQGIQGPPGTTPWKISVPGEMIYSLANVGIGSAATKPVYPLMVSATASSRPVAWIGNKSPTGKALELRVAGPLAPVALSLYTTNGAGATSGASLDFGGVTAFGMPSNAAEISGYIVDMRGGSAGALTFKTKSGNELSEKMRVHSNGNVGIGTGNPIQRLHVQGNRLRLSASTTKFVELRTDGLALDLESTGAPLSINHNGPDIWLGVNSGRVGIGKTNPVEKVDINGAIRIGASLLSCTTRNLGTIDYKPAVAGFPGTDAFRVCTSTGWRTLSYRPLIL